MFIDYSKIANSKKESKNIDFKSQFDIQSSADCCETVKDIVAMANSGGGFIVFGVNDDGTPSSWDITTIITIDSAKITDQIVKFTKFQFDEFSFVESKRGEHRVVILHIKENIIPLVFYKEGQYLNHERKTKIAFQKGTIYFRHGAKSEPCDQEDIKQVIEREISRVRHYWFGNIRKLVKAPPGSKMIMLQEGKEQKYQITDDENAPKVNLPFNEVYKYFQNDIVKEINKKLEGEIKIGSHYIYSIRKLYDIDTNRSYFYRPLSGRPQFSQLFLDWILKQYHNDPNFFKKAVEKYYKSNKLPN